jgi:tetratricopeptide (TPR) repeat protein
VQLAVPPRGRERSEEKALVLRSHQLQRGVARDETSVACYEAAMSEDNWEAAQPGAELVAEGDYEAAVRVLTELIESQPENEYAYFYLGSAYYELEDYPRALKSYVKALEIVPSYVGAMVNAGHTLRMLGRFDEAARMGQQVLARAPDDADALFLIGAASFARGDYAKAQQHLERFLNTSPEIEVAMEVEGMLQVIRGKLSNLN